MVLGILGIGLIGGSIALALKKNGFAQQIIGVDNSKKNADKALELGIVDNIKTLDEAIDLVDMMVLCVPVSATNDLAAYILDRMDKTKLLVDMGSTKASICDALSQHSRRSQFVAVHPIAGTEDSGPEAAFARLMFEKIAIICEKEKSSTEGLDIVERLLKSMFMSIHYMSALEHDKHIAYVSHLSHATSFALGITVLTEEENEANIFTMAGSGFASTARLAKSASSMWAPIFQQNKQYVVEALDAYMKQLERFKKAVEEDREEDLTAMMDSANKIRKVLKK